MGIQRLPRVLGLISASSMVAGTVIGSGVFRKAPILAQNLPDLYWVMAVWVLGGLFAFLGGLCFAESVSRLPQAGGNQGILTVAYGPMWGFLWGWTDFWIIRSASIAALVSIFVDAFIDLLPTSGGPPGGLARVTLGSFILMGLGGIQLFGMALGARLMVGITGIKVLFLLVLATLPWLGLWFPEGASQMTNLASESTQQPTGFSARLAGLGTALLAVLWAYHGWGNIAPISEEVKDPKRNIPKALFIGLATVTVLYILVNLGYHLVMPMSDIASLASHQAVATEVFRKLLGVPGVTLASLAILCSVLGSLSGNLLAGPRLPFAMARSGQAPQFLAMLHPVYKTPIWSIVALVVWSVGLLWIGLYLTTLGEISLWGWVKIPMKASADLFDWLTNFAMFGSILFETMGVVSVLMLRRLAGSWDGYRCPWVPLIPLVYLILPLFLFFNMLQKQPSEAVMGILFSLFGMITYLTFYKGKGRPVEWEP